MNAQTKYILIALGVLGAGAGVFFYFRNKKKKREALVNQFEPLPSSSGSSTQSSSSFPLRKGDRGDLVAELQKKLNSAGSYGLAVDGIFGVLTEGAVKEEQSPFESFKTMYPNAVFGVVSEEHFNNL
jgi:LPXTG-motif cell wall-anchored protein